MTENVLCHHCRLPIPNGTEIVEAEGDVVRRFCCQGCRGAFLLICGAGMENFYQRRSWADPGVAEGAFTARWDDAGLGPHVVTAPGQAEIAFLLDGIRCASCVWLNEQYLARLPGVQEARVNFGSHRARVRFDPDVTTPGEIFAAIARLGYLPRPFSPDEAQRRGEREKRSLTIRFGTAAFLSMQLMGYSLALYAGFFRGMETESKRIIQWLAAATATPVVFYCGWPFLRGAWRSLRNRSWGMDLLVAIGVLAAFGVSLHGLATAGEVYFDSAAMLVTLLLLGRLFEAGARARAVAGIDRLYRLAPGTACRLKDEGGETVTSEALQPGDLILVRPGERFPVDGRIEGGETEVDESAVSGEALPAHRLAGSAVASGTLNLTAAVTVRVTERARDSLMARIARLVEEAQSRKAPLQRQADRLAAGFVPGILLLAGATWLFWFLLGSGPSPTMAAVSVLVIACPCALGLATPTAILVASGAGASRGILFRGGDILEKCARLSTAVFDKTGTLTVGRPRVVGVQPTGIGDDELVALAARIEGGSRHPLAEGIIAEACRRGLHTGLEAGVRTLPGRGLELLTPEGILRAGSRTFLDASGVDLPDQGTQGGLTAVHLARGEQYLGAILLADPAREEAGQALQGLAGLGLKTVLLSGDSPEACRQAVAELPFDEIEGGLSPVEKVDRVEAAAGRGERVLMVGDGINDAPALAAADVGCAMAGGMDIAMESSDLILTRPDLRRLAEAVTLARRTVRVIRQNLFWAFLYNILALPLAATGRLTPVMAAGAMTLSSICVVANSLRLAPRK